MDMKPSEAAALLRQIIKDNDEDGGVDLGKKDKEALDMAIRVLENRDVQKWVSVKKDGLPSASGLYLVTEHDDTTPVNTRYYSTTYGWNGWDAKGVTAWKQLPKPYIEGEI